jgi:hypothetical protein
MSSRTFNLVRALSNLLREIDKFRKKLKVSRKPAKAFGAAKLHQYQRAAAPDRARALPNGAGDHRHRLARSGKVGCTGICSLR